MYIHYIALGCEQKPGFVEERKHGLIDLLFLRFHSKTTLILSDKTYTLTKPCVFLIDSGTPYKYFSNSEAYQDDYLHFSPENRQQFLSELMFPLNTPVYISNNSAITDYLRMIQDEQMSKNRLAARSIDLLIRCLFTKISEEWLQSQQKNTSVPHYHELLHVQDAILAAPEHSWSVEELADMAHLSPSYFQVVYKKAFGITCMTEVIHAKIEQAKLLLTSTELPVSTIAAETGYNEVYHFIRQFKKSTGMTPGAFRKKTIL